jgi:hypothetical protein
MLFEDKLENFEFFHKLKVEIQKMHLDKLSVDQYLLISFYLALPRLLDHSYYKTPRNYV